MKIISNNKKAHYDYFLSNNLEVGIELIGLEVKGILNSSFNIKESYVKIINNEVFLIGSSISSLEQPKWDKRNLKTRDRKLLLHRSEINKFKKLTQEKSTTLVCIKCYINDNGLIKLEIALGKGKKNYDKRESIKKRDLERTE